MDDVNTRYTVGQIIHSELERGVTHVVAMVTHLPKILNMLPHYMKSNYKMC